MFEKTSKITTELQVCNMRIRTIMTKNRDGILIMDSGKTILFANPAAAVIFGCKGDELAGKRFDYVLELDKTTELKIKAHNGKIVTLEMWVVETEWDGHTAYFVTLTDITERRRNEEEFRKLYRAVTASPIMVMITDARGNLEYVNPKFTEVTGYSAAEAIGKNPRFLKSGRVAVEKYRELWETVTGGKEWRGELINRKKNGEFYCESVSISPVRDFEGNITNFIAVKEDVTARKMMEEALRESEEKFSRAFRAVPNLLIIASLPNEKYVDVNEAFEQTCGYLRTEVFDRTLADCDVWENPAVRTRTIRDLQLQGRLHNREIGFRNKAGDIFTGLLSAELIELCGVPCMIAIITDITDRKRAEEAVRESEENLRNIFNSAYDAIFIHELGGEIIDVNDKMLEMYGVDRDQATRLSIRDDYSGPDNPLDRLPEIWNRVIGGENQLFEWQARRPNDGYLFDVEVFLRRITLRNKDVILATVRDITARKQRNEALRESEALFRIIFDQAYQLMGIMKPDGTLIKINRTAANFIKARQPDSTQHPFPAKMQAPVPLSAEESEASVLGRPFWEAPWWTHSPALQEQLRDAVNRAARGEMVRFEATHQTPAGRIVWVDFCLTPVKDDEGNVVLLVPEGRDITERKLAEEKIEILNTDLAARAAELETANRELEAFSAAVSHDLRKPLTIINGYCQAIQEMCADNLGEECRGFFREIYDGTLKMSDLIDTLLNFSRITRRELLRQSVDLSRIAAEVAGELRLLAPERRATFRIADGITASGDAKLMRVAMENLLGNAWKFTGRREETVIEFGATEVEGKPVFFVRDNGVGFDMEYAEKLFVPFQRLPGMEGFMGHGIGLATVERIVRRHNGRIWAEGERGKGATFFFCLEQSPISPA
jgi:PAS domain S-box-containing protein